MTKNEQIIKSFIEAWQRLDPEELAGFFHENGCYHNVPAEPVTGRAAIKEFIQSFTANWMETDWQIGTLMSDGDCVICERIDRTNTQAGAVDLPCCGIFQLENGQIKLWRDYFDMNTYLRALRS